MSRPSWAPLKTVPMPFGCPHPSGEVQTHQHATRCRTLNKDFLDRGWGHLLGRSREVSRYPSSRYLRTYPLIQLGSNKLRPCVRRRWRQLQQCGPSLIFVPPSQDTCIRDVTPYTCAHKRCPTINTRIRDGPPQMSPRARVNQRRSHSGGESRGFATQHRLGSVKCQAHPPQN